MIVPATPVEADGVQERVEKRNNSKQHGLRRPYVRPNGQRSRVQGIAFSAHCHDDLAWHRSRRFCGFDKPHCIPLVRSAVWRSWFRPVRLGS